MIFKAARLFGSVVFLFSGQAYADTISAFGHKVGIEEPVDGIRNLTLDGQIIHENAYLSLDEFAVVGGMPVIIGSSAPGGNACGSSAFVLSFPEGKSPTLDGPLDTCRGPEWKVGRDSITFSTDPIPSMDGEQWSWTVAGLEKGAAVPFVADPTKGWDELRAHNASHPSDLLGIGQVAKDIRAALGADFDEFLPVFDGPGSVEYQGDFLIGHACKSHMCGEIAVFVAADMKNQSLYLAWKPEDEAIVVKPDVKSWPSPARVGLRDWAASWK